MLKRENEIKDLQDENEKLNEIVREVEGIRMIDEVKSEFRAGLRDLVRKCESIVSLFKR